MKNGSKWFSVSEDSRSWEDFYRKRWNYDYSVRTSHGVNCSMACSWEVFVKMDLFAGNFKKQIIRRLILTFQMLSQEVAKGE